MPTSTAPPKTVLITNDDGPPNPKDSPFIEGLVKALRDRLGWTDIRVVIPDSQKSWISKAYQIKDTINLSHYTPSNTGVQEEWTLLSGTPATCSNIALYNLYPGQIDLVISGPNFGRNTSSAFALSSGTIGAAMSASMSGVPAIALSYGIFEKPIPEGCVQKAHELSCTVIKALWENVLGSGALADVYNVNVPLTKGILSHDSSAPLVAWTVMGKNRYGRLFAPVEASGQDTDAEKVAEEAGPSAVPMSSPTTKEKPLPAKSSTKQFTFKPDIGKLVNPDKGDLLPGTDIAALHSDWVSVTPIKACFEMGQASNSIAVKNGLWKL